MDTINLFEMGDNVEEYINAGLGPHCLVQTEKKGIEQELWFRVRDAKLSIHILSKGLNVAAKYEVEEAREWFWLNEEDTITLFKIIQDPEQRLPLIPVYLLESNEEWEEAGQTLKDFFSENDMAFDYEMELI